MVKQPLTITSFVNSYIITGVSEHSLVANRYQYS